MVNEWMQTTGSMTDWLNKWRKEWMKESCALVHDIIKRRCQDGEKNLSYTCMNSSGLIMLWLQLSKYTPRNIINYKALFSIRRHKVKHWKQSNGSIHTHYPLTAGHRFILNANHFNRFISNTNLCVTLTKSSPSKGRNTSIICNYML